MEKSLIQCSINPFIIGKPSTTKLDNINLSKNWQPINAEWEEIFKYIYENGYAITAVLKDNYRKSDNFISSQLAFVDIDHGMTIKELFDNEYYNEFGAGFYSTPSYTEDKPKFRIAFVLEYAITSAEDMKALYTALIKKFGGDDACKDPARLFFGNDNATYKECRKTLVPAVEINNLINEGRTILSDKITLKYTADNVTDKVVNNSNNVSSDAEKSIIVNALKTISLTGNYYEWIRLAWGMRISGYSYEDFSSATHEDSSTSRKVWDGYDYTEVTMGTVMYILKNHMSNNAYAKMWEDILQVRSDEREKAKIETGLKEKTLRNDLAERVRRSLANG